MFEYLIMLLAVIFVMLAVIIICGVAINAGAEWEGEMTFSAMDALGRGIDNINSCTNLGQLDTAKKYCDLLCRSHANKPMARFMRRKFEAELAKRRKELNP